MTCEVQSTLEASGINWPALRNHIASMAHVIQLALGAFMSSLVVKSHTRFWEAYQRDQQFGENESIDTGKSQRLRKEGNPRINIVSAMRPDLANIIEKVSISRYFESSETNFHNAENTGYIDYTNTWLSKRLHLLSQSHIPHHGTTYSGCEDSLELDTGVAWGSLTITRIHPGVAPQSKIQWKPATLHNTGWMDHRQVDHGRFEAIPILDPVEIGEIYGHIASRYHSPQWHVRL